MHWPIAFERTEDYKPKTYPGTMDPYLKREIPVLDIELTVNHEPTWRAMEGLVRAGKTKHIGVSNFSIKRLKLVLEYARIKPMVNQVELHPYLPQKDLLAFSKQNDILLQAHCPLGGQVQVA